jgi:hypothetical protein
VRLVLLFGRTAIGIMGWALRDGLKGAALGFFLFGPFVQELCFAPVRGLGPFGAGHWVSLLIGFSVGWMIGVVRGTRIVVRAVCAIVNPVFFPYE